METAVISHQGWGDLYSCNALFNHYSEKYNLTILVEDQARKKMMDAIFADNNKITNIVPEFTEIKNGTCIICHTDFGSSYCPRDPSKKCKYIKWDYDLIKIGAFNNFSQWSSYISGKSFSHCFYSFHGVDIDVRINKFKISRNTKLEEEQFSKLKQEKYVVIHDDPVRGYRIDTNKINSSNIYNLNMKSDIMIDQIKIIEEADELHFIDSSYSLMIYFLSFQNEKINKKPKFLHTYSRGPERIISIYSNPTPDNWYVL